MISELDIFNAKAAQRERDRSKPIGGRDTGNLIRNTEILADDLRTLAERKEPGLSIRREVEAAFRGLDQPKKAKPR